MGYDTIGNAGTGGINPSFYTFTGNCTNTVFLNGGTGAESEAQITFRTAGSLTLLWCRVTTGTTSGSTTVTLRKGGANGNNTFSIAQGLTGAFSDTTPHTDSIAVGDKVCISANDADTTIIFSIMAATYSPTTASVTLSKLHSVYIGGVPTPSSIFFTIPAGGTNNTTEADAKLRIRKTFTARNCCVNVIGFSANSITVKSRLNGANGGISVSVTQNTSGIFEDTSGSDNLASGNDYDFTWTQPSGGAGNVLTITIELQSSSNDINYTAGEDDTDTIRTSVTLYSGLMGGLNLDTTESDTQVKINTAMIFSQLICNVFSNTLSTATTIKLRANAANPASGPTVSINANTNGLFFDNVNTYSAVSTDLMNYQITSGSTGTSLLLTFISVNGNSATGAAAVGPSYQHFGATSMIGGQNYDTFTGGQMIVFGY